MAQWFGDASRGRVAKFFGNRPTLAGYWQLNGSSQDNSGNGNNGTDTSLIYGFGGRFGKGATFNGTSSAITIPSILTSGTGAFSILAWAKITGSNSENNQQIAGIWQNDSSSGGGAIFFSSNSNNVSFNFRNSGGTVFTASGGTFPPTGLWQFVAGTYDGSNLKLYLNGKLIGSAAASGTGGGLSGAIGALPSNTAPFQYWFPGVIEEVAMFSEALPAPIISQYYALATRKKHGVTSKFAALVSNAFTKTLSASIMNGASRFATVSRLAAFTRKPSDSIMNSVSRLATVAKGLTRSISASIMNASSRFAAATKVFGANRTLSDSIMNAVSRSTTVARTAGFMRSRTDSIMNAASRFATVTKGRVMMMSDSIMNAKGRLTTMKAYVNGLLIQFSNKFMKQSTSYTGKHTTQGTTYTDKLTKQGTDFENKYQ